MKIPEADEGKERQDIGHILGASLNSQCDQMLTKQLNVIMTSIRFRTIKEETFKTKSQTSDQCYRTLTPHLSTFTTPS